MECINVISELRKSEIQLSYLNHTGLFFISNISIHISFVYVLREQGKAIERGSFNQKQCRKGVLEITYQIKAVKALF